MDAVEVTTILSPLVQAGILEESEILIATKALEKQATGAALSPDETAVADKISAGRAIGKAKAWLPLGFLGYQMLFGRKL